MMDFKDRGVRGGQCWGFKYILLWLIPLAMAYYLYFAIKEGNDVDSAVVTQLGWVVVFLMYYSDILEQETTMLTINEIMFGHSKKIKRDCDLSELRAKYKAPTAATDEMVCKIASRDIVTNFFSGLIVLYECDVRAHCVKKIREKNAALKAAKSEGKDKAALQAIAKTFNADYSFFEQARWGGELELQLKPTFMERLFWVGNFYGQILTDPEDGATRCFCWNGWGTKRKLSKLMPLGGIMIVIIELYGFANAFCASGYNLRDGICAYLS